MNELNLEQIDHKVHQTVIGQRGISKRLAEAMGVSQHSFLAKVDPRRHDTHLSPTQLMLIMDVSGDYQVLEEMAYQSGYVISPRRDRVKSVPMVQALMEAAKEKGDFAAVFIEADDDKLITRREEEQGVKEIEEEIRKLEQLKCSFQCYAERSREGRG